jgi:uncharacterized RDD family membrane protein YckC
LSEENLEQEMATEAASETTTEHSERYPDATRLSRLFAQILDGIILMFVSTPLMFIFNFGADLDVELWLESGVIPVDQVLSFTAVGIFIYLLVNGYHLWYFGQTLGKKMMKIAIVDRNDKVPAFAKIIGLRYVPFQLVGAIPGLALISIVDILMIFRSDRRCLHDMLAGTRVINVSRAQDSSDSQQI